MSSPPDESKPKDPKDPAGHSAHSSLISDEPTIELVVRAREGDRVAVEALLERCLPSLRRWARS